MAKREKYLVNQSTNIFVRGARENNLKNLTVSIPRGKLVGVTGVSGSGKSSLIFDVIAAEGHRKYVESLSTKARQALEKVSKPDVDYVEGLSPVLSIEQLSARSAGPRSTVATATEIADYARLLWATAGTPHCPQDGAPVTRKSLDLCVEELIDQGLNKRMILLAPWMRAKASVLREEVENLERRGFQRLRIDGKIKRIDSHDLIPNGTKGREIQVELVIDRIVVREDTRSRLADSLEIAFEEGDEHAIAVLEQEKGEFQEVHLSQGFGCNLCGATYPTPTPKLFSWNHPEGACTCCGGLGEVLRFREDLIIPDPSLSLNKGAIKPWRMGSRKMINLRKNLLNALSEQMDLDLKKPWEKLPEEIRSFLLNGNKDQEYEIKLEYGRGKKAKKQHFPGILKDLQNTFASTTSDSLRAKLHTFQYGTVCEKCKGSRLSAYSRSVLLAGCSLEEFFSWTASQAWEFIHKKARKDESCMQVEDALHGLEQRLGFLNEVGLGYLGLDRPFRSLSGGEAQRSRLATQLGMGLVGVIYALDEPSVGLHPADHDRLINVLHGLRDRGNTVLVVEHDAETLLACDHLIEVGPGPGTEGGNLIYNGSLNGCKNSGISKSGPFLAGKESIEREGKQKKPGKQSVFVKQAKANNLQNIDASFPIGLLTVVCGVSGSGKSSLVNEVLAKSAAHILHRSKQLPGAHGGINGLENFDQVVRIDQSPIGKSPRSNPATYVKLFDQLRSLFAKCSLSKVRGYGPGRFSFNIPGGRCERCKGDGVVKLDMQFLADVYVKCESCHGKRYNRETLEVRYRGRNISEVLELTVSEAKELFLKHPAVINKLETLDAVGLGYLKLGQAANTLSGGEAQRLKLSLELSRKQSGRTLYLMDEPTTGLHWLDIQRLLDLLFKLRDSGNTLVVIEHNLDIIRLADHVIEIGPSGGQSGGKLIFEGTPKILAGNDTPTGKFLAKHITQFA